MDNKRIISCEKCGAKLRIPSDKNILVHCPSCSHSFRVCCLGQGFGARKGDPLAFVDLPISMGDVDHSAPYVTIAEFWENDGPYSEFSADWRCDKDALNTYFNVHCWYKAANQQFQGINFGSGYTGFQNVNGGHLIIFSMWETAGMVPDVAYCKKGARSEKFYGEGTGMKICLPYDWKVGIWYTLHVKAETIGVKTFYSLYASEEGAKEVLMATISFPKANLGMPSNVSFLEDFTYNGLERAHSLRKIQAVTMNGRKKIPKQYALYEYDSKMFRVQNQSLKCTYSRSMTGVISIRSSGRKMVNKSMFPAWI